MRLLPALKTVTFLSIGIVFGYWINTDPLILIIFSSLFLVIAIIFDKNSLGQIALVLAVITCGAVSISSFFQLNDFASFSITVKGIISDIPHYSDHYTGFPLDNLEITSKDGNRIKCYRLLWVNLESKKKDLVQGTTITLTGSLYPFEQKRNPSDYNYRRWRIFNNYLGSVGNVDLQDINITENSTPFVYKVRSVISKKIDMYVGKDAPLIRALILGIRRDIDPELKTNLQNTGLAHLLAVSGMHIGFVVLLFITIAVALNIPIPWRYVLIICGILIYAIILPPRPSTVRAVIMAVSLLAGPVLKKWSPSLNSLGFAALVILAIRPGDIFDAGFQLSFAAVGGIIIFSTHSSNIARHVRDLNNSTFRKFFRVILYPLLISTSVSLMIYPILSIHFGIIPLLTIVYNLIAIPLTGLLFLNSWLLVLSSLFWDGLAETFGNSLSMIIFVWKGLANLAAQNNYVVATHFTPITVFALVSITIWLASRSTRFAQSVLIYLFAATVIVTWQGISFRPETTRIWFVDVGQGDGTIIILPDNTTIVIDAGTEKSTAVADMLKYLDRNRIDLLVASHSDADHIGGLINIIKKYEVITAIKSSRNSNTNTYRKLMKTSLDNNVTWNNVFSGDIIGGTNNLYSLSILNPPPDADQWSTNNASVVMRLATVVSNLDSVSILLTGDIEQTAEFRMIENSGLIPTDILKVPHHGSATSTSQAFLYIVKPKIAVISRGKWYSNRNDLSLKKVTRRLRGNGIEHYITLDSGALLFESDYSNDIAKWEKIDWRNPTFIQWLVGNYR